jgi:hypothetical protein
VNKTIDELENEMSVLGKPVALDAGVCNDMFYFIFFKLCFDEWYSIYNMTSCDDESAF